MTDTTSPTGPMSEAEALAALSFYVPIAFEDWALAIAFIYALRASVQTPRRGDGPDPVVQLIGSPGFGRRLAEHRRDSDRGSALALLRLLRDRRGLQEAIAEAGLPAAFLIFDCD